MWRLFLKQNKMKNYKVIAGICICVPQKEKLKNGTIKPESYFEPKQLGELIKGKFIALCEPTETLAVPVKIEARISDLDINDIPNPKVKKSK